MYNKLCTGVAIAALTAFLAGPASALTLQFDENGNGILNGTPETGVLETIGGFTGLTYALGTDVVCGDVGITEAGETGLTDGLRFTNVDGALTGAACNLMVFYSDADGTGTLADTGFPTGFDSNGFIGATEANGQFLYFAFPNTYAGISDPEPLTLSVFGAGLVGLGALRRRRRQASQSA